jgi:hypothetical protein
LMIIFSEPGHQARRQRSISSVGLERGANNAKVLGSTPILTIIVFFCSSIPSPLLLPSFGGVHMYTIATGSSILCTNGFVKKTR